MTYRSRLQSQLRRLTVGSSALLCLMAPSCDDDSSHSGALPSAETITTGELTPDEVAEVLSVVGDDGADEETVIATAEALPHYLDDIATIGPGQRSTGPFRRPDLVNFAAEVAQTPEGVEILRTSLTEWGVQRVLELVQAPDYTGGAVHLAIEPVAATAAAFFQGVDTVHEDQRSMYLQDVMIDEMQIAAAQAVVDDRGDELGLEMPEIPSADERPATDVNFHDIDARTNLDTILANSSDSYASNPVENLGQWILQEMNYSDPEVQEWDGTRSDRG